ncbi:Uncharacterized protein TCM_029091 [Theobroma cacao]|uniref:Uncharacterized protein n=1 Tax=Theobroma cacao TaxID=3641 RepID=A0A061GJF7_THECC|nr:Uncharacterized protein TCM_029091 [Theobroma cacao]
MGKVKEKSNKLKTPNDIGLVARHAAYVAVMRNAKTANRDGFESLVKAYIEQLMQCTRRNMFYVKYYISCSIFWSDKGKLVSSQGPDIVEEVLNFLISDEVLLSYTLSRFTPQFAMVTVTSKLVQFRDQAIVCGLAGISLEGSEIAWGWLKVCSFCKIG